MIAVAALLALFTQGGRKTAEPSSLPSVSIKLPADLSSETVQIAYHLTGPFGGFGTYTTPTPKVHSYKIDASYEGRAAREVRLLVYASGCAIQRFEIFVNDASGVSRDFVCHHPGLASLSGRIVPADKLTGREAAVSIEYEAYWAHEFFGIADGPVTWFKLAKAPLNPDGTFQVDVTDLSAEGPHDDDGNQAALFLWVEHTKTGNSIARLQPANGALRTEVGNLRIRSDYPNPIIFTPLTD